MLLVPKIDNVAFMVKYGENMNKVIDQTWQYHPSQGKKSKN